MHCINNSNGGENQWCFTDFSTTSGLSVSATLYYDLKVEKYARFFQYKTKKQNPDRNYQRYC